MKRPRLRPGDLLREAMVSVLGHPGRSLFTALGVVLGSAAFVATLGLSTTLSHQVSTSFDVRRATEVVARPVKEPTPQAWRDRAAVDRVTRLNGVVGAGRRVVLDEHPISRTVRQADTRLKVVGLDSTAFEVIEPRLVLGRTFDRFHDNANAPVVLLPAQLAKSMGINRVGVAVFIADRPFTVVGVFDEVNRQPGMLASVVVPYGAATTLQTGKGQAEHDFVVEVRPGAARVVGGQLAHALIPEAPERLEVAVPPDPTTLRREVEGNVAQLALVLSAVALAIGTVSIAGSASAGIAARAPEIGLRRAVGARPRHVFAQLLAETTVLGAVGGLIGAATGVVVVVAVSFGNGWLPVLDLGTAALAASSGIVTGALAGFIPAWRATRIQPTDALRR